MQHHDTSVYQLRLLAAGLLTFALLPAHAAPPDAPSGNWVTESGNLEVAIGPCGAALCGTVVKVLANRAMSGPGAEMASADTRPAVGMTLLSGFMASGEGEWTGEIYNRGNGKTYSALMTHPAPDQLLVRGYVGLPMFGKTQLWRRASTAGESSQPQGSLP